MRPKLGAPLVALVAALSLVAGCASAPSTGPIEPPDIYPDRTTPAAAWQTYAWAWKTGDVVVLQQVTAGWVRNELDSWVKVNGAEKTGEFFKRGMEDAVVDEARWIHHGKRLAYLRVVIRSSVVPRIEYTFAISGRGDEDWLITGKDQVR